MSISTDTSIDFSTSTGYTQYEPTRISFASGKATLTGVATKRAAIKTPQLDASSWLYIQKVVADIEESAGFEIRFLFSFDDWSGGGLKEYVRPLGGRYQVVANSDDDTSDIIDAVVEKGIVASDLSTVRVFPDNAVNLSILVGFNRFVTSAVGSIDQITWSYGTTELSLGDEGTASGSLSPEPDYPVSLSYRQYFETHSFREAYEQTVETGTALRRSTDLRWSLNKSDGETLLAFLNDHFEVPFNWTAPQESTSRKWLVSSAPSIQVAGKGDGIYIVNCSITEAL